MPVKVLLKGFEPDIPEDQLVTFRNDLPESLLCIQCTNVSSKLYKDKQGHGYCSGCKLMCTTDNRFECSTCDEQFSVEELVLDETIRSEIMTEKVFCPRTAQPAAIEIPFSALKAHLRGCCCDSADPGLHLGEQFQFTKPKAVKSDEPARSSALPVASPQVLTHQTNDDLQREIRELTETISQAQTEKQQLNATVLALQEDIKSLKETITQKDGDIEFLKTTVSTQQDDIKSVQIRCETRIATAEKNISELKEQCDYLQQVVAINDEDRKKLFDMMNDMRASFQAKIVEMEDKGGWKTVTRKNRGQKPETFV
ncbi:uncharacterized protein LOC144143619 isoform X2 [Haemaphysalis longicornis]